MRDICYWQQIYKKILFISFYIVILQGNQWKEEMKKILVAEDTESNYLLLSIILRKEYEVHRAHDGQEAIEKFESCRPDMILMDIKMPVMDGLEATRRIRLKGGTLPIIALTANAYDSDRDKAFEAGCDDYMAKPIMAPALREMIKSILVSKYYALRDFSHVPPACLFK